VIGDVGELLLGQGRGVCVLGVADVPVAVARRPEAVQADTGAPAGPVQMRVDTLHHRVGAVDLDDADRAAVASRVVVLPDLAGGGGRGGVGHGVSSGSSQAAPPRSRPLMMRGPAWGLRSRT